MNDKKASSDEFFEDDFNDDVSLEEESFDIPAAQTKTSGAAGRGGPKKGGNGPFMVGILIGIVALVGYFGYRFYAPKTLSKPATVPLIAELPKAPPRAPSKNEEKPKTAIAAPKLVIKPVAPLAASKPKAPEAPAITATPTKSASTIPGKLNTAGFNEKDLEQFMATGEQSSVGQSGSQQALATIPVPARVVETKPLIPTAEATKVAPITPPPC